jgi:hypothetical protein
MGCRERTTCLSTGKRHQETATKVFQWADWFEESDDGEEDSCAGSIQGEDEREKKDFLPVISRNNSVGTTELQGLSTDPEGQKSQIRPEEDLPKECLQSSEVKVEDGSASEKFEGKEKKKVKNTAEDGVDDDFWDYFESCDAKKSENNDHMAASGHQGTDKWLADSGASSHICTDGDCVNNLKNTQEKVTIGNSSSVTATGRGTASLVTSEGGSTSTWTSACTFRSLTNISVHSDVLRKRDTKSR